MEPNIEEQEEIPHKAIVAICCYNTSTFGIACYNELNNIIYADSIFIQPEEFENFTSNLKITLSPTLFLLHPQIITNKSMLDTIISSVDGTPECYHYQSLKSSSWNAEQALNIICSKLLIKTNTLISTNYDRYDIKKNFLLLSSKIDLDSIPLKQSLSALIMYMTNNTIQLSEGIIMIASIQTLPQTQYMRRDEGRYYRFCIVIYALPTYICILYTLLLLTQRYKSILHYIYTILHIYTILYVLGTLRSLQIFSEEIHPNVIRSKGRNKEVIVWCNLYIPYIYIVILHIPYIYIHTYTQYVIYTYSLYTYTIYRVSASSPYLTVLAHYPADSY